MAGLMNFNLIDGDYNQTRKTTQAVVAAKPSVKVVPKSSRTTSKKSTKSSSKNISKKKSSPKPVAKSSPSSSSSGGGGGGGGGVKSTSDKPQLDALNALLKNGLSKARDIKIANIQNAYRQNDKQFMDGYNARWKGIQQSVLDNARSEHDESFNNVANRSRETIEMLQQAAVQGAGETDTLRAQLQSIRNWQANQQDINRAYFDSATSNTNAMIDLNADARTARNNMVNESWSDQEQVWANYYNQVSDTYSQLGNMSANPYSDQHGKAKDAYKKMTEAASSAWKQPKSQPGVTNWTGNAIPAAPMLNNTKLNSSNGLHTTAKPASGTLKRW